jgi:hypothetical protein
MRDQDGHGQHGMVMAAVAPAEDIDTITLHLGKRRRDRSFVAHRIRPAMIRGKEKPDRSGVISRRSAGENGSTA